MQNSIGKLFYQFMIFCWSFLILLLRPSVLGSYFNKEIFLLLFIITITIILYSKTHKIKLETNIVILYILFFVVFLYFLIQGLILSSSVGTVLNASMFIGGTIIVLFFMSTSFIQMRFVQYYIGIHFALSLSAIISLLLVLFLNLDQITYYRIDIIDYSSQRIIAFPFSIYWSNFNTLGISIPRFTAFYKEPGIAQVFLLTAFWFAVADKSSKIIRVVLLIGTILTFSAAGLLNIVITVIIYFLTRKKSIVTYLFKYPITSLIAIALVITLSIAGYYQVKIKQNSVSGESRIESYNRSLKLLSKNPLFGTGYYSVRDSEGMRKEKVSSLGLVGVAFQIGYVGVLLYLLMWAYSFLVVNNGHYLYLYLPFFITILLFQPNYNSPIIWVLLSMNFNHIFLHDNPTNSLSS